MCDIGEGDKQLVEIRARVLPAFLGLRRWRMRSCLLWGTKSQGCREETSTSIRTAWDLEVARRWLEGSWAWREVAPFGHSFSKRREENPSFHVFLLCPREDKPLRTATEATMPLSISTQGFLCLCPHQAAPPPPPSATASEGNL